MSCDVTPLLRGSRSCSTSSSLTGSLQLLLYHPFLPPRPLSDSQLTFPGGQYSAEQLCIVAANSCGILPVYHSLFALASPCLQVWYPPNHIFTVDGSLSHVVVYRIRCLIARAARLWAEYEVCSSSLAGSGRGAGNLSAAAS
ncbi:hypothetical protein FKM82_015044 [Ascaphus truei]